MALDEDELRAILALQARDDVQALVMEVRRLRLQMHMD